jgi:energy-coupling factor transporter ATP-binding protein EcfA2
LVRLVAVQFDDVRAPVARGFLALADLTVLFGANDSGKTRLLQTIGAIGEQFESLARGAGPILSPSRLFVEFSMEEFEAILGFDPRNEPPAVERSWRIRDKEQWRWWSGEPRDHRDEFRRLSTLALERSGGWQSDSAADPALMASWCTAVAPTTSQRGREFEMQLPLFPIPTRLPSRDPDWLQREVTAALSGWLTHIAWATGGPVPLKERLEELRAYDPDSPEAQTADMGLIGTWVSEVAYSFVDDVENQPPQSDIWGAEWPASHLAASRPIGAIACEHSGAIATALAPDFVNDRYRIRVEPPIGSDSRVRILLEPLDGSLRFSHSDVADGLRLWIEIAVLEAADAMRRVELNLRRALRAIEIEVESSPGDRLDGPGRRAVDDYLRLLDHALTRPLDPPFDRSGALGIGLSADLDTSSYASPGEFSRRESTRGGRLAAARPRLYLVDEPERHLNPRLQRSAAKWLIDLLRTRGAQGVIATHSAAFLNIGQESTFVELRRSNSKTSELQPFTPEDLTAYSGMARRLGFDRGELLATCRVLLFVEGRHDQAVLENAFREHFHEAGIVVVPLMGAGKHIQIVEHEVLARFTRASLAVVFDKLDADTVHRLLNDRVFRDETARKGPTERQAMAALLKNAADHHLHVEPFPLPVEDIFDAIDEHVIRDHFPQFPGHEEAHKTWADLPEGRQRRKRFYEENYGIPDRVETYIELATLMHDLHRITPVLRTLADQLERLAMGAD